MNFDSNDMIDIRNEIIEILTDFMKTKTERPVSKRTEADR